jgi:proline iminopeptidase
MIIRAVFLARQQDLDWFAKNGANQIYPEQWQQLLDSTSQESEQGLIEDLCDALWSDDELARVRVAKAWDAWGAQVSLGSDYQGGNQCISTQSYKLVLQARMELHYARQCYFIAENQILENCAQIKHIDTIIIHGRNDLVCPIVAGYQLKQQLSYAEFRVLPNAGHVAKGTEMIDALVSATDRMADKLSS